MKKIFNNQLAGNVKQRLIGFSVTLANKIFNKEIFFYYKEKIGKKYLKKIKKDTEEKIKGIMSYYHKNGERLLTCLVFAFFAASKYIFCNIYPKWL